MNTITRLTKKFTPKVLDKARAHFELNGSIAACERATSIHRTTISRVVEKGRGEQRVIDAITEYLKTA